MCFFSLNFSNLWRKSLGKATRHPRSHTFSISPSSSLELITKYSSKKYLNIWEWQFLCQWKLTCWIWKSLHCKCESFHLLTGKQKFKADQADIVKNINLYSRRLTWYSSKSPTELLEYLNPCSWKNCSHASWTTSTPITWCPSDANLIHTA